jgi:hypothetical protein
MGKFWGCFFEGFLLDVMYEDLVPFCLVILLQQTLRNDFDLGVFGGFYGKVFLRVDFRFLLVEWVLGTELSYGPPWAHYLGGYQDRLLGGPLGLPDLCRTVPDGVRRKDYGGEVLDQEVVHTLYCVENS